MFHDGIVVMSRGLNIVISRDLNIVNNSVNKKLTSIWLQFTMACLNNPYSYLIPYPYAGYPSVARESRKHAEISWKWLKLKLVNVETG